ncbi:MAG: DUF4410 domain-containing protein [Pseudomonadota bacterium]
MKARYFVTSPFFALALLAGCASTEVTEQQIYDGEKLARPDRIIVEDFAVTPDDLPEGSAVASHAAGTTPQTPEEVEDGRKLADELAKRLVADLQEAGLPAVHAAGQPPPQVGDIVIKGSFITVDEGSAGNRIMVGFGAGTSDLQTVVEGYEMTAQGLRRLASAEVTSEGGKTPGMVAPLAVAAATANPIGLIVVGGLKLSGEATGSSTIEGRADATADEIADKIKKAAEKQGWIAS